MNLSDIVSQTDIASNDTDPRCAKCHEPESECPGKTLYQHPRVMGGALLCADCYADVGLVLRGWDSGDSYSDEF